MSVGKALRVKIWLLVVVILSLAVFNPVQGFALEPDSSDIKPIQLNQEQIDTLKSKEDVHSYGFTPQESGSYVVCFDVSMYDWGNVVYEIYDEDGNALTTKNPYNVDRIQDFAAHQTYVIKVYTPEGKTSQYQYPYHLIVKKVGPVQAEAEIKGTFSEQSNKEWGYYNEYFSFTPVTSGVYTVKNTDAEEVYIAVWDGHNYSFYDLLQASKGQYFEAEKGRTYFIGVSFYSVDHDKYSFRISRETSVGKPITVSVPLWDVAYGNGVYAAVGDKGTIKTSSDCITWTDRTTNTTSDLVGIIWGNNEFLAYGWDGTVLRSRDGISWTGTTIDSGIVQMAVWDGKRYVVMGSSGVLTSKDGINWTLTESNYFSDMKAAVFNGSRYLVVGGSESGSAMVSKTGQEWTVYPKAADSQINDVIWAGGKYWAAAGDASNGKVLSSKDGTSWTAAYTTEEYVLRGIAWNGKTYVAIGDWGTILASNDGTHWFNCNPYFSFDIYLARVKYCNGRFVAVGRKYVGDQGDDEAGVIYTSSVSGQAGSFNIATKSTAPDAGSITASNNYGGKDSVKVTDVVPGDVIRVYAAETDKKPIGTATVGAKKSEVSVSVKLPGTAGGSVYISATAKGGDESDRVRVNYDAEPKSDTPNAGNITVNNNAGGKDKINVDGLWAGDIVRVYDSETGGKQIGAATVARNKTGASVSLKLPGASGGSIYVAVLSKNKNESDRVGINYSAEPRSSPPNSGNISIGKGPAVKGIVKITVTVNGLTPGDIIKAYSAEVPGKSLGSATVGKNKSEAVITVRQKEGYTGSIFLTLTNKDKLESDYQEVRIN